MDRRELLEVEIGHLGEKPRDRRLARPRRPPKHHRGEPTGVDHAAENAVLAEEVVLADHLVERGGAQTVGERSRRALREACSLEQSP